MTAPLSAVGLSRLIVSNIRRARRRLGMDQARFALALDIPKWRLTDIEADAEVIGCDLIIRAAEVLHLDICDLFAMPDERRAA